MGIGDFFKAKENEALKARVTELESMLTPEMLDSLSLKNKIEEQKEALEFLEKKISSASTSLSDIKRKIEESKEELIITNEEVLMQSFGIYTPHYSFANSTAYKDALADIRKRQKDAVKSGNATQCNTQWSVNGSREKGIKMTRDTEKLLLRAFNTECDDAIASVKFNNIESAKKRIETAYKTLCKLGKGSGAVTINDSYLGYKIQELYLAYEYQVEKQKEKDRLKQLRAEDRERAKLEKEIQEARKKIEKEQKHYVNALEKLKGQMKNCDPSELEQLKEKQADLEERLGELGKSMEQIDYRAANQKAGYVYIISNVGAFGENVYKIGMTRRLEPMDRIDELGDASVPFDFDVHALIFSDDAPALETALHHAFEERKLNMVNTRREFFRVSLDEIKKVVQENYDKTVEFVDIPMAEQFRLSEIMRQNK